MILLHILLPTRLKMIITATITTNKVCTKFEGNGSCNANFYIDVVSTTIAAKSFTYKVTALTDTNCTAQTNDLTGSAVVTLTPGVSALLTVVGSTNICLNGIPTMHVD